MNRRKYLTALGVASAPLIAGCSSEELSGDNGSNGDWDFEETYSTTGDIEEELIGELEEGDEVEFEIEVNQGRFVRASIINRDTAEGILTRYVYRSDQMESYNASSQEDVASVYNTTVEIEEFGEYYARLALIPQNLEVVMRFRTL
ncbi:hypothetical protein GRX03_01055 [Halovenus sp. WSH3]|uniref:Uncharacterized protein n=1 Tax=Halovenus carboxidivorans TaxID=2692199 RepID=A0A6B0TAJ1_9EURY|nr:hypothetical protein [Halovenus carboxidivorans]MXR50199.1 hypothetical protein [Halovenus carboxidivorans]